jgi:hypothetical protein
LLDNGTAKEKQMETVYRERANGRIEHWTYSDGILVFISQRQADVMLRQGAKLVNVR